jgi:hypothetical protein
VKGLYHTTVNEMIIPERAFAPIGQRGRASLGAAIELIEQSCKELQVTKYQLAGLLGCNQSRIYRWLSGERSPSAFYLARLTQLWILQWKGLPVHMIRKVMWEESMVLWRDGSVTCENHLPGGSGALPPEEGRARWDVAEFLHQQRRDARAYKRRKGRASPGSFVQPQRVAGDV